MDVQVILTQNDPKLGKNGEVVKVSSGHAYNYLIPQGKAKLASESNLRVLKAGQAKRSKEEAERLAQAREWSERIKSAPLVIETATGPASGAEGEKLYGAVTTQDIADALAGRGIPVERKEIHLAEPIKKLGEFHVSVRLHHDVTAVLELKVVRKDR